MIAIETIREHIATGRIAARERVAGEYLWAAFTCCLFILMGPFSAIAVLAGLYDLGRKARAGGLPEPDRA